LELCEKANLDDYVEKLKDLDSPMREDVFLLALLIISFTFNS
jgi:hypothetical protein